jgi:hypothetical protein
VRPERIELSSHPWQGRVLPLNHDRSFYLFKILFHYNIFLKLMQLQNKLVK